METSPAASSQSVPLVDPRETGFAGLDADAFMRLLIAQLQNQDPTDPSSSDELLQQLTTMQSLQSNIELADALESVALNQQLNSGAALLGKDVTAVTGDRTITGVVDRILVKDGEPRIGIGPEEAPLDAVTEVRAGAPGISPIK